jgi:hypothetical protein|nr:MAG TPA: hypothetical protein [Bacteriophage sp.]DAS49156.1 MAG TPA: hypothetical protein [Caudoviricetes sp.]DAU98932.1 MAG TPA: hypothetical protein [Bacteriophage sp.]DAZ41512.1 MAG TPA: hypothetical protein [Caudoviricetes sp.]
MRILSQDRTASIDESGVSLLVVKNYVKAILNDITLKSIVLGEYRNEDRAMEVLAEIHALYEELPFSGSTVFYMPKE